MNGRYAHVEPLRQDHEGALWAEVSSGGDPALWDYLPYGPFGDRAEFAAWQAGCRESEAPRFFAVSGESGAAAGMLALARDKPQHRVIELAHVWFGPSLQHTRAATEAVFLAARHAFDDLGYRRLEWKCNADNDRSRRAGERFGFTYEGTFRQHMIVKGRNRDTAWFSMLDSEWPARRDLFERWLAPENFDAAGRQLTSLR